MNRTQTTIEERAAQEAKQEHLINRIMTSAAFIMSITALIVRLLR